MLTPEHQNDEELFPAHAGVIPPLPLLRKWLRSFSPHTRG